MAVSAKVLYVGSDNRIAVNGLRSASAPNTYINDAVVKMSVVSKTLIHLNAVGVAVNKGGGKVGLPSTEHGLSTGAIVHLEGTDNYDAIYTVDATSSNNEIVVTATYVAETFTGNEYLFVAVKNAGNLALEYVADSDGKYLGNIPDTAKLVLDTFYYVLIHITAGADITIIRQDWKAVYNG